MTTLRMTLTGVCALWRRRDLNESLTDQPGQDHAAQAAFHQEPTGDHAGHMHAFFGQRQKGGENGGKRNSQQDLARPEHRVHSLKNMPAQTQEAAGEIKGKKS